MIFLFKRVDTSKKYNFFLFQRVCLSFSTAHQLQSTALDPDYGLFIGYQMPADEHEGLNQFFSTCVPREIFKCATKRF